MVKKSFWQLLCEYHLTPMENKFLTYEQKQEMVNYGKRMYRDDWKQGKLRSPASVPDEMSKIIFIVNDLPITRIQKDVLILRLQKYTFVEIGDILGYSDSYMKEVLDSIKDSIDIDDVYDSNNAWRKKFTTHVEFGDNYRD